MKNRVRLYRHIAGLNQETLAKRAGITRQTLSLIEKGEYNPSLKLCMALCLALGRNLNDLFWMEGEDVEENF